MASKKKKKTGKGSRAKAEDRKPYRDIVPIELDTNELAANARRAAQLEEQIEILEADKAKAAQGFKAQIDTATLERKAVLQTIRLGTEDKEVEVFDRYVWRENSIKTIVKETGLVVRERAMTSDDRQLDLEQSPHEPDPDDPLSDIGPPGVG